MSKPSFFRSAAFALAVTGALMQPVCAADSPDPVTVVLSPGSLAGLDRDTRCHDARVLAGASVAPDAVPKTVLDALLALEHCAALPRTQGWDDYISYAITAAAATAVVLGRLSGDTRAYSRAIADARHVPGFDASRGGRTWVPSTDHAGSRGGYDFQQTYGAAGPGSGPTREVQGFSSMSGVAQPSEYGALATDLASIANTALAAAADKRRQQTEH